MGKIDTLYLSGEEINQSGIPWIFMRGKARSSEKKRVAQMVRGNLYIICLDIWAERFKRVIQYKSYQRNPIYSITYSITYSIIATDHESNIRKLAADFTTEIRYIKECIPIDIKDLPLYIEWYKTQVFDKLLKEGL